MTEGSSFTPLIFGQKDHIAGDVKDLCLRPSGPLPVKVDNADIDSQAMLIKDGDELVHKLNVVMIFVPVCGSWTEICDRSPGMNFPAVCDSSYPLSLNAKLTSKQW